MPMLDLVERCALLLSTTGSAQSHRAGLSAYRAHGLATLQAMEAQTDGAVEMIS